MFLSFLMRERDRTVTVPWPYRDRDFVNISDRDLVQFDLFRPYTVPKRSPFLSIFDRLMTFFCVYGIFFIVYYIREGPKRQLKV